MWWAERLAGWEKSGWRLPTTASTEFTAEERPSSDTQRTIPNKSRISFRYREYDTVWNRSHGRMESINGAERSQFCRLYQLFVY